MNAANMLVLPHGLKDDQSLAWKCLSTPQEKPVTVIDKNGIGWHQFELNRLQYMHTPVGAKWNLQASCMVA